MYYGTPPIVTNGLVLNLDAANTKSYVSGSTTWRDLNNPLLSGSLINGPTFNSGNGGCIVFDGINDYAQFNSLPPGFQAGMTNYSFSMWFKLNTRKEAPLFEMGSSNGDNQRISLWATSENPNRLYAIGAGNNSTYRYSSVYLDITKIYNVTYTYNNTGTISKLYINGIEDTGLTNSTTNGSLVALGNTWVLGADSVYSRAYTQTVNIYNFMLYAKTLSAQEVTQNYNALKSRFI